MPTLQYSGSRRVPVEDAPTTVPNIVETAVGQINDNKTITVENLQLSPGANGGVSVAVTVSITGTYGELSTLESTLAEQVAGLGFEPDAETAMNALTLA